MLLSDKPPKEGTSGDVPSGTFSGTFKDLICGMRSSYNVAMYPPLHVIGFCRDKHARNKGIAQHRVPTTYKHLPLLASGPYELNDEIPEEDHFLHFYKACVRELLDGNVVAESAIVLADAYKNKFTEIELVRDGIVAKPTGRGSGVGVLFIKPTGNFEDGKASTVTQVEVREFVDNKIVTSLDALTIGGAYPVQYVVEPFVQESFLKQREFRTFCTPRRADRLDFLYQVKTTHDADNCLGVESYTDKDRFKTFHNNVWSSYRKNNKRFRTDSLNHVVFRIDSYNLSNGIDASHPMLVNEIEVFPMAWSFIRDAQEGNEQIQKLAGELKQFIIEKPMNYPV